MLLEDLGIGQRVTSAFSGQPGQRRLQRQVGCTGDVARGIQLDAGGSAERELDAAHGAARLERDLPVGDSI